MRSDAAAIWQKTDVPFGDLMQRTERTYVRTNERYGKHTQIGLVLDSADPVHNRFGVSF